MNGLSPDGVAVRRLVPHTDDRGVFIEIFRDEWGLNILPECWELLRIPAGERRAVEHLLIVLSGAVDLEGPTGSWDLTVDEPRVVTVAPGAGVVACAVGGPVVLACGRGPGAAARHDRPVADPTGLPQGVELIDLAASSGSTRLYDSRWGLGVAPVQWNAVRSAPGVLRGVHCHAEHADLLHVAAGRMRLGLADLRVDGGDVTCIDLVAERPQMIAIPPGVAHGFLFLEASLHVYAVDRTWDLRDELGCRWDDAALAIAWGHNPALISPRDLALGSLAELKQTLIL